MQPLPGSILQLQVSTRLDALDLFNVKREEKREAMRRELEEAKKGLEEQEKLQAEMAADIETAQRTTWGRTYNGDEIAALTGKELTQYKRRLKRYGLFYQRRHHHHHHRHRSPALSPGTQVRGDVGESEAR
jgi:hypothetical protein